MSKEDKSSQDLEGAAAADPTTTSGAAAPSKKKKVMTRLAILEDRRLLEIVRTLQQNIFPVKYSDTFYENLFQQPHRMNHLAYFNDVLVGIVCVRLELASSAPGTPMTQTYSAGMTEPIRAYIMTLGTLKPYRRLGIASQLLDAAMNKLKTFVAENKLVLTEVALHVQVSNDEALALYKKKQFIVGEVHVGYYKQLNPSDAHLLTKKI